VLGSGEEQRVSGAFAYQEAIDGLRALAVLAVIAYHLNYGWATGGFLGVDLFFVLSGFLITTLLIVEWRQTNRVAFRKFWTRRARRLLPALLLVLVSVAVFTHFEIAPWNRVSIRGDGLASLLYVANWRFIADKLGYFQLFSAASPLRHMWSLAIEEQFYVVWPIVVYGALRFGRGSLRVLTAICCVGVVASVAVMANSFRHGDDLRAYYGTDARAHTILIGALLAILLATWTPGPAARRRIALAAIAAFGLMVVTWSTATGTSARYYDGGAAAYAVLACVVVAGALQPGVLRAVLAIRPLVWIGRRSYGLYLFHWPLIVWLVPSRVGLHGLTLDAVRLGLTFVVAAASFRWIEAPIRDRRRLASTSVGRRPRVRPAFATTVALGTTLAVVLASSAGAEPPPSYLSGSRVPTFSFSMPTNFSSPSKAPDPIRTRSTRTNTNTKTKANTKTSTRTQTLSSPTLTAPTSNFPWSYGDPLFCADPRPSETREAVDAARAGPQPVLRRPAEGLRILVVGDSTACSFFPGLRAVGDRVGAFVAQAAVFGCGVASGQITTTRGEQVTPHTERCPIMVEQAQLPAVAQMRPDVVVWMSLWEKSDVVAGGRTLASGTPAGDAEMLRRMDAALDRLSVYGAKVVLVTVAAPAPNDAQGTNNTSNAIDDASYARLDDIDRRFAARHPGAVTLLDLAHQLCPKGPPCPEQVDGLRMRPDGRHFTPKAATIEAQWALPRIVAAS
jgi:peptidoglycan/LPS O-acetylase OafA/YrhL